MEESRVDRLEGLMVRALGVDPWAMGGPIWQGTREQPDLPAVADSRGCRRGHAEHEPVT